MEQATGIGLIGCGNISSQYLDHLRRLDGVEVIACADRVAERAMAAAATYGLRALTVEQLLADPAVAIVLNLTIPGAHREVSMQALAAGRHVYSEKPLALTAAEGRDILAFAAARNLLVGCGPDTFMGPALHRCRQLVDAGRIGRPVAATLVMANHGHESWHPDPAFYYRAGGGPLLDMGPYYLTALVQMMGEVASAQAITGITFAQRTVTSEPRRGELINVEVPTHVSASLEMKSGAIVTVLMSFDVWHAQLSPIVIFGTEGTLLAPDPNGFGGAVRSRRADEGAWEELDIPAGPAGRGLGLAAMVAAIREGRTDHPASGAQALHVLATIDAIIESGRRQRRVPVEPISVPPAAVPHEVRT